MADVRRARASAVRLQTTYALCVRSHGRGAGGCSAHESRERAQRIDFVAGLEHTLLKRQRVPLRLDGILRRDQRAHGPFGEVVDRRIQQESRQKEDDEQREDTCRDRGMPIPHDEASR